MKFAYLTDRSLIEISGEDAEGFLDNILTCNIIGLAHNEASFGALLNPQGKILFDFFVVKTSTGYLFDIAKDLTDDFIKRLTFYRLRAKVTIEAKPDLSVVASWGNTTQASTTNIKDPRLDAMGIRDYTGQSPQGEEADYTAHRIANGMPQGGHDFEYGSAYPHETLMDQFGGVDFKKGCYVGQEVISRMQHRGTVKKRIVIVFSDESLPSPQTIITADDKLAGTLGSVSGNHGLAMLRLDRIAKANTVLAGETKIEIKLPTWVDFEMPGQE